MLPAAHGDAILVEYGPTGGPQHRFLIDGGPFHTYPDIRARLDALTGDDRRLELLVISHIDADHIEGAIKLLGDDELGLEIGEVWFNGYRHLPKADLLGAKQAEMLSEMI